MFSLGTVVSGGLAALGANPSAASQQKMGLTSEGSLSADMIVGLDAFDHTIRIAYGNEPTDVHVEEYTQRQEAILRVDELRRQAAKILVSPEGSFLGDFETRGIAVSRLSRLEGVFWSLQQALDGHECLIVSIGINSCAAGLVSDGRLIKETGEPRLGLWTVWQQILERNLLLKQAVDGLLSSSREPSRVEREVFEGFSRALQGERVERPVPFFRPFKLSQLASPVQELLARLDPQRRVRTLVLTDWAIFGGLPQYLEERYRVIAPTVKPFAAAVTGMVLFGLKEMQQHTNENDFERLLLTFRSEYEQQNFHACLPILEKIRALKPSYPDIPKMLAELDHATRQRQIQLDGTQIVDKQNILMVARGWLDEGEPHKCIETLAELLRVDPTSKAALDLQGKARKELQEREELRSLLEQAQGCLHEKNFKTAHAIYTQILQKHTLLADNWGQDLVRSIGTELKIHEARVRNIRRTSVASAVMLAVLAVYFLWPATPVETLIDTMISLAERDGGRSKDNEISAAWEKIKRSNIKDQFPCTNRTQAKDLNSLGLKYSKQKNYGEAHHFFQKAHNVCQNDVEIVHNYGYSLMRLGQLFDAEKYLLKALSFGNDKTRTYIFFSLGQTYARQGEATLPRAVACFANGYRFSTDKTTTYRFLQDLAANDDNSYVRNAAKRALQLKLVRG